MFWYYKTLGYTLQAAYDRCIPSMSGSSLSRNVKILSLKDRELSRQYSAQSDACLIFYSLLEVGSTVNMLTQHGPSSFLMVWWVGLILSVPVSTFLPSFMSTL